MVMPSSTLSFMPFALPPPVRFVWIRAIGSWSSDQIVMLRYERLAPPSRIVRFTVYWPLCRYLYVDVMFQPVSLGVEREGRLWFEAVALRWNLAPARIGIVVLLAP